MASLSILLQSLADGHASRDPPRNLLSQRRAVHRALSSIILHVRSSASKERPWGAIFDAVKALLASPLPLFSRPLQLALGEACVVAAEAGGPSCAAALVAHLLALLPARSASNNPFALRAAAKPGGDGDGPASARAAALHVLGDLFTAFGSALAPQLGEAARASARQAAYRIIASVQLRSSRKRGRSDSSSSFVHSTCSIRA